MSVPESDVVISGTQRLTGHVQTKNVSRLTVLLVILALAGTAAIYDVVFARALVARAETHVAGLVEERTRLSAEQAGFITPADVHQALGAKPTWIERHPDDGYEVEYYCAWGYVPLINSRRHFLAIVYVGNAGQLIFDSHHLNRRPPREALPMPFFEKRPGAVGSSNLHKLLPKDRPVLRRPIAAVWLEPKQILAVANERSGSISIVNVPKRNVIDEIIIAQRLADLAAHPTGDWFFAVDPQKNEFIVLRRVDDSIEVAQREQVGTHPLTVAVSPSGNCISVASLWSRKLSIFQFCGDGDTDHLRQMTDIALPFNPREQEFLTENVVLVNDSFARRSAEVHIETHAVTVRDERTVFCPDPARRLIKGIEARSEIRGSCECVVAQGFAIALGPSPILTPEDRGEDLFFSRKISATGQSCHDCHPFGHTTFELADTLADGTTGTPKRVVTLLGTSQTYPWAWNGAVNELDDQVRRSLETTLHVRNVTPQQVIDINSFLHTLSPPPPLEPATNAPDDRAQLLRGQSLFHELGCVKCHVPTFTYTSGEVFDVGLADEKGLSKFNPPSLLGVGQGYSFFHDGRAKTLSEVFAVFGHGLRRDLSPAELADLLRFLRSL